MKNRKNWKRNAVIATVLLFVCAAAYLNWSYNEKWDATDSTMAEAEDAAQAQADEEYAALGAAEGEEGEAEGINGAVSDYFAAARLTRQQSRDEALSLLESAASAESASQEVIDSAMEAIAAMASWSMLESQIENELLAKDFADCVVYLSDAGATVAVPAPEEGLSEAAVARVSDTVTSVSGIELTKLKIIEVKH